jgi:putative peptidoglycan lipid II flippase
MAMADKSNPAPARTGGLLRAASTVGGWTLASRILGFVRDMLLARVLGAGPLADAFFVAFRLPNFFRRMFAEGTLTVAMVPVLAEERTRGEDEAHRFLDALGTLLLVALVAFTVLGMLLMPWLLLAFAPGFRGDPERWQQALLLARWMFPYLLLISLTALAWAVLNAYRKFSLAAASPALLNIAIIFAAVVLAPGFANPGLALAIGVLLGGALQLGIQIPALRRIGWTPRLSWRPRLPAIGRTLRLFGPAVLGVAAVQVNILVGTILATLLPAGAVSYLYYADRIVQLPLALFGIAMGTALLPTLSDHAAHGRHDEARQDLRHGLAWMTWITLPAIVGAFWLAEPIIGVLFERGRFMHPDTVATAHTLQAYAVGLLAFCWVRVLSAACYAEKDAKSPTRYAAAAVAINIVLAVILMRPFGYVGLAMATSLAAFANVAMLVLRVRRLHGSVFDAASLARIGRAVLASVAMLAAIGGLEHAWPLPVAGKWLQAAWLAVAIGGSMTVFFASAWLLGERLGRGFRRPADKPDEGKGDSHAP